MSGCQSHLPTKFSSTEDFPADDRDLRQVYDHGHAELREDVLDLVNERDEGLHAMVALLRSRHGGGRRVVDAAGQCKRLLLLHHEALAVLGLFQVSHSQSLSHSQARCRLALAH